MRSRSSKKLPPSVITSPTHDSAFLKNVMSEVTTSSKKDTQIRSKAPLREIKSGAGIPRNVNSYIHLLNGHNSNQAGVQWSLKLRSPSCSNMSTKLEPTTPQAFSVADKPILSQQKGRSSVDLNSRNELYKVAHLIRHRIGTPTSGHSVFFETGLRSYSNKNDSLRALEKKWTTVPKREKSGDFQLMYPSYEETRNIKSWSTKNTTIQMHSAFDGHTNFPAYGERKSAPKNLAETGHLYRTSGQTMPLVNWQLSMRDYENTNINNNKNKEAVASEQSLGELKKITKKPRRV